MPNVAAALKAEIARVARRELRSTTDSLKKASATQRSEIAALKRRVQELERALKMQARANQSPAARATLSAQEAPIGLRFRPAGMAANRERLGLSAREFGLLVGVSAQAINAWEQRKAKPNAEQLALVAALRGISKDQAAERLAAARG